MPVATMTTGRPPYVPEKERFGAPNGVFVQTFNAAGVPADLSFHPSVLS